MARKSKRHRPAATRTSHQHKNRNHVMKHTKELAERFALIHEYMRVVSAYFPRRRGTDYPALYTAERSLVTHSEGWFGHPAMLHWKLFLLSSSLACFGKPAMRRLIHRVSVLPENMVHGSEANRAAARAAIHLMLLDGVVLHLVPDEMVSVDLAPCLEGICTPDGLMLDTPGLHLGDTATRVTKNSVVTADRIDMLRTLGQAPGTIRVAYTQAQFRQKCEGQERPKYWNSSFRKLLWILQGGVCPDCPEPIDWKSCCVDHILPWSHGGTSLLPNLALRHVGCNLKKWRHETGWILTPRVLHTRGTPEALQGSLIKRLFNPELTSSDFRKLVERGIRKDPLT